MSLLKKIKPGILDNNKIWIKLTWKISFISKKKIKSYEFL